jgi:hypothetical protein
MIILSQARTRLFATVSKISRSKNSVQFNSFATKPLSVNGARALSTTLTSPERHEVSVDWIKILAGAAAAGTIASGIIDDKKAECCGIAGVIGTNDHDARYVLQNLQFLHILVYNGISPDNFFAQSIFA